MRKKKILMFHQVLGTYRIDQFNLLNELFDLEVVYFYDSMQGLKINQKILEEQCNYRFSYFLRGIKYGDRVFRFGMYKKIRQDLVFQKRKKQNSIIFCFAQKY